MEDIKKSGLERAAELELERANLSANTLEQLTNSGKIVYSRNATEDPEFHEYLRNELKSGKNVTFLTHGKSDLLLALFRVGIGSWYLSPSQPVACLLYEGNLPATVVDRDVVQLPSPFFTFSNRRNYPGTHNSCFPEPQSGWGKVEESKIIVATIEFGTKNDGRVSSFSTVYFDPLHPKIGDGKAGQPS